MYYYITIASNFIIGFDKYKKIYSKRNLTHSTFANQFFLLKKEEFGIGIAKAKKLLEKVAIKEDFLIVLGTKLNHQKTFKDHSTGLGQYIKQNYIFLDEVSVFEDENYEILVSKRIEDITALSYRLNFDLKKEYKTLSPRSISILPVKNGCQASCDFCFSTYSVSEDLEKGLLQNDTIEYFLKLSKEKGASRAVITGGGEPTLIKEEVLFDIIEKCAKYFPAKVVMITNGYCYATQSFDKIEEQLERLTQKGLTNLSLSVHHYNRAKNTQIMHLDNPIENILEVFRDNRFSLVLRLICVLQKEGINSHKEISNYLKWAGSFGIKEICFKELYVATSLESYYFEYSANDFSYENQISLSLVIDFCEQNGFKQVATLPWGSPLYEGYFEGNFFSIACYTEPSLHWELLHKLSRSWNIMSNGECLASLEDKSSFIEKEDKG